MSSSAAKSNGTSPLDFEVASVNLWTDSAITLNWIVGHGKKIKNYVAARVSEINKLSNIYDWRHCHGKSNPADLLTRGVRAKVLAQSSVWKYGPSWLSEDSLGWPSKFVIENSTNLMSCITETISSPARQPILPIDGYSKLKRLLRTTAFIFRFLRNSKKRSADRRIKSMNEVDEVTSDELQSAELYWVKTTQLKFYNEEIQSLSKGSTLPHDSKIVSLNPKLEDGVLRLSGRLPPEEFGKDIYMPIILPKKCHFSQLIVLEAHKTMFHAGVNAVLAQIRKKYWIVQGRQLIKTVLRHCVICKRLHGKSAYEPWTVLPTERLMTTRPFETSGVDFAGPLFVKSDSEAQQKKVYIMLFTCATIRAVHLELVGDMSVKSCIDALRRFIARRGVPATIVSDNAKTFKRTDLEVTKLNELMKANEMQQITAHQGIKWKFIPERAAWWGGFWERLVRSVKTSLKSAVGKARLSFDELATLLTEVESIVNARPLTYITNDHNDLMPLTPSNFLTDCNTILFQTDLKNDGTVISQTWRLRQTLMKRFWKRWQEDYLNQLRSIHHNQSGPARSIKIGDVVLVHEDNKPRLLWRLGVVHTVYPGRDGRVRACDIRLQNQQVLKRPIQLLYPLEISSSAGTEDVENKTET